MIQLTVLSEETANRDITVRRFPCTVGRAGCDVLLEASGVWDRHCSITRSPDGIVIERTGEGSLLVNDESTDRAILRGGDVIVLGAIKLRYELGVARQKTSLFESAAMTALVLLVLSLQVFLFLRYL